MHCVAVLQDDTRCQLGALQREIEEVTAEREAAQNRLVQIHNSLQECQEGEQCAHAQHTHTNCHLQSSGHDCSQVSAAWTAV